MSRRQAVLLVPVLAGALALAGCSDPTGTPAGAGDRVATTAATEAAGAAAGAAPGAVTTDSVALRSLSQPANLATCPQPAADAAADAPVIDNGLPAEPYDCIDGSGTVSLAALRGKPLVVNAWASWCPPCVAELPILASAANDLAGTVDFIGINIEDDPQAALDTIGGLGVPFPSVFDPAGSTRGPLAMPGTPVTFFVDADGAIVGRHDGMLPDRATFDGLLSQYLGVQ